MDFIGTTLSNIQKQIERDLLKVTSMGIVFYAENKNKAVQSKTTKEITDFKRKVSALADARRRSWLGQSGDRFQNKLLDNLRLLEQIDT